MATDPLASDAFRVLVRYFSGCLLSSHLGSSDIDSRFNDMLVSAAFHL